MSAISRPAFRPRNKPKDFIIAVRAGQAIHGEHVAYHTSGSLVCGHCGHGGMSMADFADEVGVLIRDTSAFLNRRPVRDDVARKIRANVMRVVE